MNEREIKMGHKTITVLGDEVKVGDKAPDFTVLDKELHPVKLSDFKGRTVVINSVPSVDTSVCDIQVKRFNQEAAGLKDVAIMSISVDLPFALARYCAAEGINAVKTTSDHRELDFGTKYGLVIKDMRLLSRAVIVVDGNGIVRYAQYVQDITHTPDFDRALAAIREVTGTGL
ncbi:MAG: thiol peroxidase [Alphaproteobacteria bacterium]|nr:thiol peroxidase [Alphaproteobacteria bacterium]